MPHPDAHHRRPDLEDVVLDREADAPQLVVVLLLVDLVVRRHDDVEAARVQLVHRPLGEAQLVPVEDHLDDVLELLVERRLELDVLAHDPELAAVVQVLGAHEELDLHGRATRARARAVAPLRRPLDGAARGS